MRAFYQEQFYKSELEKNVASFIEASDLYTRFQYDTKIEIAQECLEHHYKCNPP